MSTAAIYNRLGGAKIIKMPVKGEFDLVKLAESGVPKSAIKKLADSLLIDEKEIATGQDFAKKKAEQIAAEIACVQLGIKNIE